MALSNSSNNQAAEKPISLIRELQFRRGHLYPIKEIHDFGPPPSHMLLGTVPKAKETGDFEATKKCPHPYCKVHVRGRQSADVLVKARDQLFADIAMMKFMDQAREQAMEQAKKESALAAQEALRKVEVEQAVLAQQAENQANKLEKKMKRETETNRTQDRIVVRVDELFTTDINWDDEWERMNDS